MTGNHPERSPSRGDRTILATGHIRLNAARIRGRLAVLLYGALLTACMSSPNYAPVVDLHSPPERVPQSYRVRSGDTLYSIAFRYGLDYRGLAYANKLGADYRIMPGQVLALKEGAAPARTMSPPVKSSSRHPEPRRSTAKSASQAAVKPVSRPATQTTNNTQLSGWKWPARGQVTKTFSQAAYVHNGIDVGGQSGEPVTAAAGGNVVYAGNGLVGYGNLLIIKHNERYLSAYAHNSRLLVKEGEAVSQGQHIANMGDSGTDSTKLHFEIRRDGKPVDPLGLLPKR